MVQESTISERRESRLAVNSQQKMDVLLGYVLLSGVGLSMALIIVGMLWHFARTGNLILDHQLAGMNLFQFLVEEIHVALREHIRPRTLVDFGVVVLMFTPYLRVFASMIYFMAVQKNWKYSVFTAIVLGVLTFSLFLR